MHLIVEGATATTRWYALASLLFWAGIILLMIMLQRAIMLSRRQDAGPRTRSTTGRSASSPVVRRLRPVPDERERR